MGIDRKGGAGASHSIYFSDWGCGKLAVRFESAGEFRENSGGDCYGDYFCGACVDV
jgi:hypothetical protein